VLLFGDSFAACVTPPEECWGALLERSDLAGDYALLNYGAGGYGLGQISLLCRAALPLYAQARPVVVIGLLIDDDLDRALLDFRVWPKPVHRLDADGRPRLVPRELARTRDESIRREGIGIASYAWRYLCFGTPLMPGRRAAAARAHQRAVFDLSRALLDQLVASLEACEVDYVFLVFHGSSFLGATSPYREREEFLLGELSRLGAPYVLSREELVADARRTGRTESDYFIVSGHGRNHYTALGNEVVFRALRAGVLRAALGGSSPARLDRARIELGGELGLVRFERGLYPPFEAPEDESRLVLRVGAEGPTRVSGPGVGNRHKSVRRQ